MYADHQTTAEAVSGCNAGEISGRALWESPDQIKSVIYRKRIPFQIGQSKNSAVFDL